MAVHAARGTAYATAYDACSEIANFKNQSGVRRLRYVAIHVACLLIMFSDGRLAMPYSRRENVRHATLLFCAEGGVPGGGSRRGRRGVHNALLSG